MRVKETNLGGGVVRLDVEPTFCGERIPQHVVDQVMRDLAAMKSNRTCTCDVNRNVNRSRVFPPHLNQCNCLSDKHRQELAWRDTDREPDGIDVHVDRPRRENFWSRQDWAKAMAKYRTLEDVARSCDWECREPMKGVAEPRVNHCTKRNLEVRLNDFDDWMLDLLDEFDDELARVDDYIVLPRWR